MENPKIRFKGFTKDWEQRKVTDLGEIYIGLVTTMTEHYTDKGHLLIRNSDIKDGYFEFGENPIYLDEEFSERNKLRMHQLGDVITVHTGDIGTSAVIGENEVNSIGFATIVTRPNQEILDSNYFATYLNTDTHKQWAVSMATGDGRSNYNLKDYTKLVVPIPEIEEQKKIAACIVNLNSLITLHQRKCEQTKKLKKYMLQKMFPQNGAKVPEIRFYGFTYDWEQRKLIDYLEVSSEKNRDNRFTKEDVLSVSGEYGIVNQIEFQGRSFAGASVSNYGVVENGDVVYTKSPLKSNPYGIIKTNKGIPGIVSTLYAVYKPKEITDSKFVQIYFELDSRMNSYMHPLVNKGAKNDMKVSAENALKGMVSFPKKDEQEMISLYFSTIDHLITLHQRKCDELKKMKKYMLQNMFI